MVKIPRYKEQNINLPTGQTDLTSSAVGSQTLSGVAESVRKLVSDVGAKRNALAYRMRRLEIGTNVQLGSKLIYNDTQTFFDSLMDREDFLDPDQWLRDYDEIRPKLEKKYKKMFDEETWTEFRPYFEGQVWETQSAIKQEINTQKIKNAGVAFSQSKEVFMDKVDKADSVQKIEAHWESYKQILNKNLATDYFPQEFYTEQFVAAENFKNMSIAWLAVKEGEFVQNPFGENEVDWSGVLRNLKEKVDGEYKYISDLDPDIRKEMIKEATGNFNNQDAAHTKQYSLYEKATFDDLGSLLLKYEAGDTDSGKNFLKKVDDSNLRTETKRAMRNWYIAATNNLNQGGSFQENTDAKAIATAMVMSGYIDTEEERMIILQLGIDGHLKSSSVISLINNSIKVADAKNSWKTTLYKRAVNTIASQLGGGTDFLEALQMMMTSGGDIGAELMKTKNAAAYEAINALDIALSLGEKKNYDYIEMLTDVESDVFLVDKIVKAYKTSQEDVEKAKLENITDTIIKNETFEGKWIWNPYKFFTDKKEIKLPIEYSRQEDEELVQYLKRIQKENKKIDPSSRLPSSLTGNWLEGIDLADFMIVPELEE